MANLSRVLALSFLIGCAHKLDVVKTTDLRQSVDTTERKVVQRGPKKIHRAGYTDEKGRVHPPEDIDTGPSTSTTTKGSNTNTTFSGSDKKHSEFQFGPPWWVYILGGVALVCIVAVEHFSLAGKAMALLKRVFHA